MSWPTAVATNTNLFLTVNNTVNILSAGIDDSVTVIPVIDASLFPSDGFITIDGEIIKYTGKTATTFTGATRGADGSVAAAHLINDPVEHFNVAAHHNAVKDEIIALETDLFGAISGDLDDGVSPTSVAASIKVRLDHFATQFKLVSGEADWKTAPADTLFGLDARATLIESELTAIQTDPDDTVTPAAAAADLEVRIDHIATQLKLITGKADWKDAPDNTVAALETQQNINETEILNTKLNTPNILTNGGGEVWQRGTSFVDPLDASYNADKWQNKRTGTVTFSRESGSNVARGIFSIKIAISSTNTGEITIYQDIENFADYKTKTVSFSASVKASISGDVRISIDDGLTETFSNFHTGGGGFEILTVTATLSGSASLLRVRVGIPGSVAFAPQDIYADAMMLVLGTDAVEYVPENRHSEFDRCLRWYEESGVARTKFWDGQSIAFDYFPFRAEYKAEKAATPTVTLTPGTLLNNIGSTVFNSTTKGFAWRVTAAAGGPQAVGFGEGGDGKWTAEV